MDKIEDLCDGIDMSKLMTDGYIFDTGDVRFSFDDADFNLGDEDEDDNTQEKLNDKQVFNLFGKYDKEPFDELWNKWKPLLGNDLIHKSVVTEGSGKSPTQDSTVKIMYCNYFDGKDEPFGTSGEKPFVYSMNSFSLLLGIEKAILSMKEGEYSKFLVSHELMYGKMSCGPDFPPKAMCLLFIKLMSVSNEDKDTETIPEPGIDTKMSKVYIKAKSVYKEAKGSFDNQEYRQSQILFSKALKMMAECPVLNEDEEKEQKSFLSKCYLNLATCENHLKNYGRACHACNCYKNINPKHKEWRIFYQHGLALENLGEFKKSTEKLNLAFKFSKDCPKIKDEIIKMQEKKSIHEGYNKILSDLMNKLEIE